MTDARRLDAAQGDPDRGRRARDAGPTRELAAALTDPGQVTEPRPPPEPQVGQVVVAHPGRCRSTGPATARRGAGVVALDDELIDAAPPCP